jgi:hypothetical protein
MSTPGGYEKRSKGVRRFDQEIDDLRVEADITT